MKMHLYFGDYYDDGHGKYHQVTAEVPSEQHLIETIARVKEKYPKFFATFCRNYDDQSIGSDVEKALLDTEYTIERFAVLNDNIFYDQFETLAQLFSSKEWENRGRNVQRIEFVADAIVWVLNAFGGEIIIFDEPSCPCYQFGSGYGMFW